MKILWMTWKDLSHPLAGGAEVVNEELAKRLVADGHEVIFIVGSYKNAAEKEVSPEGYEIIRLGNRVTVYHKTRVYYQQHLRGWADLVIDEVNTMPFFAKFYVKEPNIIFAHMLCRRIWFYQLPLPLSLIGYLAEPLYMRMLSNKQVITVSESTKQDLLRVGFKPENIHIISEGISLKPVKKLPPLSKISATPTMLSLGAMRPMKRTLAQVRAYELAKRQLPGLRLAIAGDSSGRYGQRVLQAIKDSPYSDDITYHGRVSEKVKIDLIRQADVFVATAVKEGWGLVVTEANSQGTPAVVYNVDGLRDSVRNNETGLITEQNNPQSLAGAVVTLLTNRKDYMHLRKAAWEWSKSINFTRSYEDFKAILDRQ